MLIPFGVFSAGASTGSTYELISTTILGSTTSTVTFSSIPQTYKHLQLRMVARSSRTYNGNAVDAVYLKPNSVDATKAHWVIGNGSSVSSQATTDPALVVSVSSPATNSNVYTGAIFDLIDYTNTNKNRVIRGLSGVPVPNNGTGDIGHILSSSSLYLSTAATTSLVIGCIESYLAGSRFSLYGIKG
jgi:hypothetical protein